MAKIAFACACHPDDIEFYMAGTLWRLREAGYELHYMNVANGSCGTAVHDRDTIVRMRREEAQQAARLLGATWHPPLTDDMVVLYEPKTLRRLAAIMREVAPEILLVQSPSDYMEDHQNTVRLAVSAAFCRGMVPFPTDPPREPVDQPVTVYHAPPHGNRDPLRRLVRSGLYVDITDVLDRKRDMLACHKSQKEWLDHSQGMDSYLHAMETIHRETGALCGAFAYAEGWRRRNALGFCAPEADPLYAALREHAVIDAAYERELG